jgi:hypothetical protein
MRLLKQLTYGIFLLAIVAVGLEVALRIYPAAIPLELLRGFDDDLRIDIAQRRGLPTQLAVREVQRDDGGPPLYIYLPHEHFVHDLKIRGESESAVMDERGFCNPPPIGNPPYDVVTLGGSIAWCHAVDAKETWTALLARLTGLSTYNISVQGIGPYEYVQLLKRFGLSLHPRMVIMNIGEENDTRDVLNFQLYRQGHAADTSGNPSQTVVRTGNAGGFLARYSYLYGLIRALAAVDRVHRDDRALEPAFPGVPDQKSINYRYSARWGDQVVELNADNSSRGQPRYAMALVRGLINLDGYRPALEEFARLARENHFIPVVLYTPTMGTTYRKFIVYDDPSLTTVMKESAEKQRQYIAALSSELKLYLVDLTPSFQAAAETLKGNDLLYFPYDSHLSSTGHRTTAETLAQRLPAILTKQAAGSP